MFFLIACFSGCTSITIITDNKINVNHYLGIPFIKVDGDGSVFIKNDSVGVSVSQSIFSIGYLNEIYFKGGAKCQLILFEPDNISKEFMQFLNEKICIINEELGYEFE